MKPLDAVTEHTSDTKRGALVGARDGLTVDVSSKQERRVVTAAAEARAGH
jgi:hypothetical protein